MMKEKSKQLQTFILSLMMLIMGAAGAWADSSVDITQNSESATTWTSGNFTVNIGNGTAQSGSVKLGNASFTISTSGSETITGASISYGQSSKESPTKYTLVVTTSAVTSNTGTRTWSVSTTSNVVTITNTTNDNAYIGSVTVYYTGGSTYTVSFADGTCGGHGSYTGTPIIQASAGAPIALPTVTADAGYYFDGWYTANNGTGTKYASGASMTPASSHTLYAWYVAKSTCDISVSPNTGSVYVGKTLTIPSASTVSSSSDGAITYSSSDTDVATVNSSTGEVSGVTAGEATITISQAEGSTYLSGSTSYTVTVNAAPDQYTVNLPVVAGSGSVSAVYGTGGDPYNDKAAGATFTSGNKVSTGTVLVMTATPSTGYTWNKWSSGSNKTDNPLTFTIASAKNFEANFTAKTYTITLDKGTGGATDGEATATYNSSALTSVTDATHATLTLKGYYTAASDGTMIINADGTLVSNVSGYTDASGNWIKTDVAAPTLYAQWEESVTPSGGTVTITYMSSPAISYSSTGTGITSTSTAGAKSNSSGHKLSDGEAITITTGSSSKVITGITVTYDRYNSNTTFAIVGSGTTTTAYSVTGTTGTWAGTAKTITITGTADTNQDRIKSIAVTYSDGGAVTKHSVTYALGAGTGTVPTQADVAEDASFEVAAADGITPPTGKTFMYWSDGVNNYAPGSYYTMGAGNVTLTAYYGYNITYTDANEKGTMPATVVGTSLTSEILAAEPTAIDDGYEFEGWYTNSTFTTKATAGTITADTPLYANYKITGTISSSPSGAVVSGQAITTTATGDAITGMYIGQKATAFTAEELKNQDDNFIDGKVANWTITGAVSGALKLSVLLTDGTFYGDVLTNDFTVGVAAPVLTCANNTVTMTCATDGATIYYTTDGSDPTDPTSSRTAYNPTAKPTILANTTFKAIAIKDEVSSDVTTESFAYTSLPTETTLFHTDFITADNWTTETISGASNERTINGTKVTFGCNSSGDDHKVYVNTSGGGSLTFENKKMECSAGSVKSGNPKHFMAIHLTGVNGSITVNFGDVSKAWYYTYDDGSEGTVIARQTSSTGTSFTIENLKSDKVTLYLGQDKTTITELTITTPTTKLTANPEKVSFIGNTGSKVVRVSTNSTGTVGIKTNPTSSIATITDASYNSTTKIYTMTVNAVNYGETEVVMQVPQSAPYPAKEITIPIEVVQPEITIDTAPKSITFAQNDAAEQKFTVAASTTTGGEVSYQWYTCDEDGDNETEIAGAISGTYVLSTTQKATTGDFYYTCKLSNDECDDVYTSPVKAAVTAIAAGTYNATVYYVTPGETLTYTDLSGWALTGGNGARTYCTASLAGGTLTIEGTSFSDDKKDVLTLTKDDKTITINVSVKKHKVTLVWSANVKEYTGDNVPADNSTLPLDNGTNNGLPKLIARLYENGDPYEGQVTFYSDDPGIAYFEGQTPNTRFVQSSPSSKPTIKYGNGQGGCKFYAYIDNTVDGIDSVKVSYDLRVQRGYSNDLPSGRKVEVQQQYTLWKNATDKLVTVTYGGYKYNDHKWEKTDSKGKTSTVTDAWGTAANYVGKDKAIDGYLYAVRNKDNDAADEYKHAVQDEDEFGSAWYKTTDEGNPGGVTGDYQRIKPFRLPCRASYLTFTAHESGTLTAYVYQNGIVGRGGNANQLASGPRLGYWFDEEGWVQNPTAVLTKQTIANANARDMRAYSSYSNMDEQMKGYWREADDQIIVKMLRSKYCKSLDDAEMKKESNYELDELACDTEGETYSHNSAYLKLNPYYWGDTDFVTANNAEVVSTPEKPILHEGGYMIVNEGYVKYTLNVVAGKTYYFFGKMTKVGYAGMNFVPADSENRKTARVDLAANDDWSTAFGKTSGTRLNDNATTIYNEITVPSNYRIGKWNTICLPFAVNENQVEQVFGKGTELAIFNGLRHDTENHVYYIKYLRHVDQNILPGQPYLIYPTGRAVAERTNQENGGMAETGENVPTVDGIIGSTIDDLTRLTFKNVIINKGVTAKSYGCNVDADGETTCYVFTGTDKPTDIVKYDIYNTPKTGELKRYMGGGTTLNTYHALMKASDSKIQQDAITFAFTEDDVEKSWESSIDNDDNPGEATGIVIIEDEGTSDVRYSGKVTNGKSYNMMGQQVDPTSAKGIVIKNGKKVMY